ncbi:solute carrier family 2, facilitated glucose transporter member 6-like isoform X2 [Hemibagrus wyckioides]|uniref:solute carrier family 2, facilitated glucose transporter member 6-like isoform X2 n=1 Tax=Hemibagrus wyckioides TaxID=337641 RepID=UPI00266C8A7A|nr:solute carrier family 2, facilitated glucose transporter member 6-like isoform X2 [Hemibagrus wyckioides]
MASEETTPLLLNTKRQIRNGRLYVAAFSAILGSFVYGYSMVLPSAVIPQVQEDDDPSMHMNVDQISWFGSVFAVGAIVGGLIAMLIIDKIGRKHTIMMSVIPSTVGFLTIAPANKVWLLLLGRCFTGVAAGITASSVPVYVSEISHPGVRGFLGSSPEIMIVIGGLALYALDLVLPWRWLAVAGEVPVLIMAGTQWSDLKSPFLFKPILISVFMRILQQMTGIAPTLVYLEPIFEKTAVSLAPKYDAAIVGFVRLVTVIIAAGLMDKAGRKSLLYISAFIMHLAMLTLIIYTLKISCNPGNITVEALSAKEPYEAISSITVIPLISIIFITLGYEIGWGPITCLLMPEILPMKVRGIAAGLSVVVKYITAFVLTDIFMHAVDTYGLFAPFVFFGVVCVVNIIFTAKCVPETKGRTLEEIENYFKNIRTFSIAES